LKLNLEEGRLRFGGRVNSALLVEDTINRIGNLQAHMQAFEIIEINRYISLSASL